MNRRDFGKVIAGAALVPGVPSMSMKPARAADITANATIAGTQTKPLTIGMLLYPQLTLLDLIGPQTVLSAHAKIHLIWKTRHTLYSDRGVGIEPDTVLEECPAQLDVLFVPGGPGMIPVMKDDRVLDFLRVKAATARYVTAVCTGSLVLGAAGLLNGYKATTHWAALEGLKLLGAEPVNQRIVVDRNRITGGGVTAGIDFGLTLLANLRGDASARVTQLLLEYDPQPPFDAGSPDLAGPMITELALDALGPLRRQTRAALNEITRASPAHGGL